MSDLELFKGGIPAHLQKKELDEATRSLMGVQSSVGATAGKRISIKAGVFRMIVDGEEVAQNQDRAMNVIIVSAAPKDSRTFYAEKFVEGQKISAPDCWSNNGDYPDAKAKNPQSKRCVDCPQNQAGSAPNGKRACRYSRRVAVSLENDLNGDVYQLTIPANSLWNADNGKLGIKPYAELLGSHNLNVTDVVTEIRFDTTSSSPKLGFKAIRPLTEEEIAKVQELSKTSEAQKAIGHTPAALDGASQPVALPAAEPKSEPKAAKPVEPIKEPVKREKKDAAPKEDVGELLDDWAN
jgi:hypothetical protein